MICEKNQKLKILCQTPFIGTGYKPYSDPVIREGGLFAIDPPPPLKDTLACVIYTYSTVPNLVFNHIAPCPSRFLNICGGNYVMGGGWMGMLCGKGQCKISGTMWLS